MSIKAKITAAIAILGILYGISSAVTALFEHRVSEKLANVRNISNTETPENFDLTKLIKDIQINVIQVQQWLTDISATRGLDGLDDGFKESAAQAESFNENIDFAL